MEATFARVLFLIKKKPKHRRLHMSVMISLMLVYHNRYYLQEHVQLGPLEFTYYHDFKIYFPDSYYCILFLTMKIFAAFLHCAPQ